MASSKIKGIVIEIGGDTSKLQKSLNAINAPINKINKELNDLNKALKLDPKNTELLAQKQEVLSRNIAASKDKLVQLKEAQKQMGDYSKLTDEQKAAYNRLSLEISKSESALKGMNDELKNTNKLDLSKVKEGLKKVGDVAADVSKKMLQVTTAVAGALTGVIGAGVKSYAELEKAQRGSQKLFEDSYNIVEQNAAKAYKTMGISATQYYDQVNTYAVGLKNSLNGDTKAAAQLSNSILVAQADIVAATGASQDAVSNAFAAVMRGNYTMLDNLRVGIKGSKEGMQEVIDKVNAWNKANGNATKYQMGNYADMQQALVDYVEMQGIAGAASTQLGETISGSVSMAKSSWDNFINGSGTAEDLATTLTNLIQNISKALQKLAPTLLKGIVQLLKNLIPEVAKILIELVPDLLSAITDMIDNVLELVSKDTDELQKTIDKLIEDIIVFITDNLPKIVEIALQIVIALANGIANNVDKLIPAILECIITIIETVISKLPDILKLGINLIGKLGEGIKNAAPKVVAKAGDVAKSMINKFTEGFKTAIELGKNLVTGIWNGISSVTKWILDKIKGFGKTVLNGIKSIFGIHSPSTVMRDQVGKNLGLGLVEGIEDTIPQVENAMRSLTAGVDASVNPTINPTANSNPLFVTIDKFYNNRQTDIQQLAEELEFYRKNSALAKGGV